MITLYNMPLALNCYKVRLTLSLLDIPHRKQSIDLLKGEHQTPEFLRLNPFGQLPVVTEGNIVLRDSQAIMVWLARKFDDGRWLPRDPDEEALVNSWLSAAAFEVRLGPYDARLAKLFPNLCVDPVHVMQRSAHALRLFNERLTGRDWVALDHPTLADIAAFPGISQGTDGGLDLAPYAAIQAWMARFRALPRFIALLD